MSPNLFNGVIILSFAYLLGSIPFGLLLAKLFKLQDPRTVGSESIGATNVLRSGHKGAALLTLLLDLLKGSAAVILSLILAPSFAQLACIVVVMGHIWPVWLKFKGGKGVATAFGVLLILSWPLAVMCLVSWLAIFFSTRYSSLAALLTVLLSPLYTAILSGDKFVMTCLVLALMILWAHRKNITRLVTGKETKIGTNSSSNHSEVR
ncbi:MAG: glycerol-3-phosphate 1-O-acyltransferase PlsY [Alphaproteobacteria bacterium]|nr:glycerol-3-phosphate 1-O-acyltransferase PlsY [Alphaproteobacteria bacterium]